MRQAATAQPTCEMSHVPQHPDLFSGLSTGTNRLHADCCANRSSASCNDRSKYDGDSLANQHGCPAKL